MHIEESVGRTTIMGVEADHPDTPPGTRRTSLDRRRILEEAVAFIDERGVRALTMRRLGAQLSVDAMALYRYVPSREKLLDGIVETVVDELYDDPDVQMDAANGWRAYLQRLAHGVRRIALAHPEVFPLIATRPPAAPWVRPPLRSLRWVESFLDTLLARGFSDAGAVAAYRAFSTFLLGHLLLEVSARGVDTGPTEETVPGAAGSPTGAGGEGLHGYPHLQRLEPQLSQDQFAAEFEESLANLLDRIGTLVHR
jgi:AcrR family transcriptional regulator